MIWSTMKKLLPEPFVDLLYAIDEEIKEAVSSARNKDWLINMIFMIPMHALIPLDLDIGYKCSVITLIYLTHAYRNLPANYLHLYYGGVIFRFFYLLHLVGCIIRALKIIVAFDDKELGTLPADIPVSLGFLIAVDYAFYFVEPSQSVYSRMLRRFQDWTEPELEYLIYKVIGVTCIPILFILLCGAMAAETSVMPWLVILGAILIVVNLRGTPRYLFVKSKANEIYRSIVFTFTYVMLMKGVLLDEFCYVNMIGKVFDGMILYIIGKIANALEIPQPEEPSPQPSRRRSI